MSSMQPFYMLRGKQAKIKPIGQTMRVIEFLVCMLCVSVGICGQMQAQSTAHVPRIYGPYNGIFLADGTGLKKSIDDDDTVVAATSPVSMYCWFWSDERSQESTIIAGIGDTDAEDARYIGLQDGKLELWLGKDKRLLSSVEMQGATWHFAAMTFDGVTFRVYGDGKELASGHRVLGRMSPMLQLAPEPLRGSSSHHFGGRVAAFTIVPKTLSMEEIKRLSDTPPEFSLLEFEEGSKSWPIQTRGQDGYRSPLDPLLMPHGLALPSKPVDPPVLSLSTVLRSTRMDQWILEKGWRLVPQPKVHGDGAALSTAGFNASDWWPATVPGTVLTTMVDRGIYPDPDFGLNNLAIPESLNKQDYWYRIEFDTPKLSRKKHFTLTFQGINYAAEVWFNGTKLGDVTGAFIRGTFDVTSFMESDKRNALAVRIMPPPHPGIPHEQSIKAGAGENGGIMTIDGPTFIATEGWDWIPGIRDRDSGIWQDVVLTATSEVRIGDAQVVTALPLPKTDWAKLEIDVPLLNVSQNPVEGNIVAIFEKTTIEKHVTLAPGENTVKFLPEEFTQLTLQHPRLWWPNGYGKPELYRMKLLFNTDSGESDVKEFNFGVREFTYEVSLLDATGHLKRVEIEPTAARFTGKSLVDVSHAGIRQIADGWAASLPDKLGTVAGIKDADDIGTTDIVIKVNGIRIACRGGNWGMDDSRKRVSRERMEPYFRLHRDANLNIIRNWAGQNTEEVFYALADEYGMLVWNDFWESTQNYNLEPQDPNLFLQNARDTIMRFRHHASIVMWCGRNEGVPQPIINVGLAELTRTLDGTRYYSPSSNRVNLRDSGPYGYQDPANYYAMDRGFSVELGVPSMPTLESFQSWIPKEDQWPIGDSWAYHDWHQSGGGDVAPFMEHLEEEFGAPVSLEDFERKAQMMNYVDHRAIFEGFNAHLWSPNSGRLLWMTQPAWPSTMWQMMSSDYDTQASYYGIKKACEPVHVQLDLNDYRVDIVNATTIARKNVLVHAAVYSLDGKLLFESSERIDLNTNGVTRGPALDLDKALSDGVVLVRLLLRDEGGKNLSDNFYWVGEDEYSYRKLDELPLAAISVSATADKSDADGRILVHIENHGKSAALAIKLTLENALDRTRILPAYLSDNYVSLLPGESRDIQIDHRKHEGEGKLSIGIRGWNSEKAVVPVLY